MNGTRRTIVEIPHSAVELILQPPRANALSLIVRVLLPAELVIEGEEGLLRDCAPAGLSGPILRSAHAQRAGYSQECTRENDEVGVWMSTMGSALMGRAGAEFACVVVGKNKGIRMAWLLRTSRHLIALTYPRAAELPEVERTTPREGSAVETRAVNRTPTLRARECKVQMHMAMCRI